MRSLPGLARMPTIWLALLALGHPGALLAQDPSPDPAELPQSVVISGSLRQRLLEQAPHAIAVVEREDIQSAGPMLNLSEALVRAPGLVANNRSNHAQDLQISSRGFGSRAGFGVRGMRILVDGLPATGPDGQGQVSQVDLGSAQRIEVLRGPFSALYGHSSGGVISVASAPIAANQARMAWDVGSLGLLQARLTADLVSQGAWRARLGVSQAEIEGFRPQSGALKRLAAGQWHWHGGRDQVALHLGHLWQPADDPLGLTQAQLDAGLGQTAVQAVLLDSRKVLEQTQGGLVWSRRFDSGGPLRELEGIAHWGQRAVGQWLAIAPLAQASPSHGGAVVDLGRRHGGVELRLRWAWPWADAVAGVAVDGQRDRRRGYENFTGPAGAPVLGALGALRRDEFNLAQSIDAFAQVEWPFGPSWLVLGGFRAGRVRLSTQDGYLSNGDDSGHADYRHVSPVAGVRWRAAPGMLVHASWGQGFETPTLTELAYRPDGTGGFNAALRPQSSAQWEAGLKWRQSKVSLDLVAFRALTRREIVLVSNAFGRSAFQNAGSTRRDGFEAAARWAVAANWRVSAALTLLQATYRDGFLTCQSVPCLAPDAPVPAGRRLPGSPPSWAHAELLRADAKSGQIAVEWRGVAAVPVNDRNSQSAAGYGVLALRWSRSWGRWGPWTLESLVRMDNLLDRRHVASVIVNEASGRFYEPAPPRSLLVSLRLSSAVD